MVQAPPDWLVGWAEVVGMVLMVVVYFVLAYLYKQQKDVLTVQHEPSIVIEGSEFNGNDVRLTLSNHGGGLAKNLMVRTTVEYPDGNRYREEYSAFRVDEEHGITNVRSIEGDATGIRFDATPFFPYGADEFTLVFDDGVAEAVEAGYDSFSFDFDLVYTDQLDRDGSRSILANPAYVSFDPNECDRIKRAGAGPKLAALVDRGGATMKG